MRRIDDDTLHNLEDYLTAIEREEDVTIVAAWVMGSHARDVASEQSDIDIKFVYVQPILHYPSLTRRRMSLRTDGETLAPGVPYASHLKTEELEFMGWNALRFLELLGDRDDGNNPSVIECLMSPLTVRTHPTIAELYDYVNARFNIIELFNHYRGLAKRNWNRYIENEIEPTVKRILYILRGVVYARYIRDTHTLPTLSLSEFADTAPDSVFEGIGRDTFMELVEMKANGHGSEAVDTDQFADTLNEFVESELQNPYPEHVRDETMDAKELDEFMFTLIRDARQ